MSLLPERLPYSLQEPALPRILLCVTQEHTAFGQCIGCCLPERLHSQQSCRNDGDLIQSSIEDRLRWVRDSISVPPVVSVSHNVVSCMTFLAFCLPRWIYICVVFKFACPNHCCNWNAETPFSALYVANVCRRVWQ